jgi:hypothetical protein
MSFLTAATDPAILHGRVTVDGLPEAVAECRVSRITLGKAAECLEMDRVDSDAVEKRARWRGVIDAHGSR